MGLSFGDDLNDASPIHRIRLLGPWQVASQAAPEEQPNLRRIDVRTSGDWNQWLPDGFVGTAILRRSFNWVFPQPAPRSVELRFSDVNCRGLVELNGRCLGNLQIARCLSFPDLPLQSTNVLQIVVDCSAEAGSRVEPWLGDVYLAIQEDGHSRAVRDASDSN